MDLRWVSNQNNSNWTDYDIMGGRPDFDALPKKYHIYLILLYTSTATFALVSNLLTLFVLKSSKRTSRNLSKYLINLSVSDILMSVFTIPFTYTTAMFGRWYFDPRFCPVVLSVQFASVFISVYTLVAIGIDRYIAIKTPIRSKTIVNLTNLIIGGIWVLGLLLSSAVFSITDASHVQIGNDTVYICEQNVGVLGAKVVVGVNILVTFLLPVSILVYVYSSMALVIFRRDLPNTASLMIKRQQRKIIKVMMVVVLMFILSWLPLHLHSAITHFIPEVRIFSDEFQLNSYVISFFACHWLAMAHSCVDPIIYSFMSSSFRKEFFTLCCKKLSFVHIRSSFRRDNSTSLQYIDN